MVCGVVLEAYAVWIGRVCWTCCLAALLVDFVIVAGLCFWWVWLEILFSFGWVCRMVQWNVRLMLALCLWVFIGVESCVLWGWFCCGLCWCFRLELCMVSVCIVVF